MKRLLSILTAGVLLTACNSTENVLKVEEGAPSRTSPASDIAPPSALRDPSDAANNVTAAGIRMRFAPIIGAPVEKVTPMSRRLNARARAASIEIVASNDATATHVLKGYFSVLGEGSTTTVIYVFDVLDTSGNRLHRIQGQEVAQGSNAADPWASIPAPLMESIADKAMTEFSAWSNNRAG